MEKVLPVTLKCRLEVKTPLSITTGEEYTFLEYTIKGGKFYLIDFERFIEKLKKEGKFREFFGIMRNFSVYDIPRLQRFFIENVDESVSLFVGGVDEGMKDYYLRKLRNLEVHSRSDRKRFLAELSKFAIRKIHRNPLTGIPYVPGSTIKGAIRTAVLNYLLEENLLNKGEVLKEIKNLFKKHLGGTWPKAYPKKELEEKKKEVKELLKSLSKVFSQVDSSLQCEPLKSYEGLFEKKPFSKDLMRFLKVSDFYPVGSVKTSVGISRRFRKGEGKLPHYLEYVKEGVFEGEVALYPQYLKSFLTCPLELSGELLVRALRKEFGKLFRREREFLGRNPFEVSKSLAKRYKVEEKDRLSFVKLGFGAGALSKTFSDDGIRVVGNANTGIRNIPSELTLLGRKPLGWCVLEVVEQCR